MVLNRTHDDEVADGFAHRGVDVNFSMTPRLADEVEHMAAFGAFPVVGEGDDAAFALNPHQHPLARLKVQGFDNRFTRLQVNHDGG